MLSNTAFLALLVLPSALARSKLNFTASASKGCRRHGGQQPLRVRVLRARGTARRAALLDDAALLQHEHLVAHQVHHRQVVADEEVGHAQRSCRSCIRFSTWACTRRRARSPARRRRSAAAA
jgi:hypothetical protein